MSKLFTAEELKNGKMLCNPLFLPLLLNELEAPLTPGADRRNNKRTGRPPEGSRRQYRNYRRLPQWNYS